MENSLEFIIPEGYEIDKEKSIGRKVVYKKVEKYVPKKGDLVFAQVVDQKFMFVFGDKNDISLANIAGIRDCWEFKQGIQWYYNSIRPASSMERDLFIRILSEHGYEYDPVEKVTRKKQWRAQMEELYYYIKTHMH